MSQSVSDFMLTRLSEWGVKRIYGYPGDGINGIMAALTSMPDKIKFTQARHEEMAAFMACGHAKFTGEIGICLATSGPGAIRLLNGLYDAVLDHQPVVAIIGQQARAASGGHYQQEVDLKALFKDVAHEYLQVVNSPAQIRQAVDRAMRIAQTTRSVTCIIIPSDVQDMDALEAPSHEHGGTDSGLAYRPPRVVPDLEELRRAAEVLNKGQKVAILVGAGAQLASDEITELADILGAGVAKALLGKAVLPDDLPYVTGALGILGTQPSQAMMQNCDTLLMIGTSFPYVEFLPKEGAARGVQIDLDARMINIRYPMEVGLVGDTGATLRELMPLLERKQVRAWQEEIIQNVKDWWQLLEERSLVAAEPINPQRVFWELSPRLPANCIISSDSGSLANWYARDLKLRPGMLASLSGGLASMGASVPYAIAAKFTQPGRPAIALVGDGAMQMSGNAELVTVKKYWHQWQDPRFVVVVINSRDLKQVSLEQGGLGGQSNVETSQDLPEFPYAHYAELLGFVGIRVDRPEQLGPALDRAFSADRPVVLDVYTDPRVAAAPPHLAVDQEQEPDSAVVKGEPENKRMLGASIKQTLSGFFSSRDKKNKNKD